MLGTQLSGVLSAAGKIGSSVAKGGVIVDLLNGDVQGALYDSIDFVVYDTLADAGAGAAIPTLGASAPAAAVAMGSYYNAGGAKGLTRSTVGCD
jgi:hypothetical protein